MTTPTSPAASSPASLPAVSPVIERRDAQPYVGIRRTVTMQTIGEIADELPGLFGWLAERGLAYTAAPFFKYNVIDMQRELQMEIGIPIEAATSGDGRVFAATLPAGDYATVTHIGHPDELEAVTAALLAWADREGLRWDMVDTPDGQSWGCRLEHYQTDPAEQPDMSKWQTQLAFRLAS